MNAPVISVIVPVYNAQAYLRDCLNSIAEQTITELEVILVDDGSSDGSGAICDEYARRDSRFRVIHQPNGGPSAARNAGLEVATGEWITFVDSDDTIEPDLCAYLLELAMKYGADLTQCGAFWVEGERKQPVLTPQQELVYPRGAEDFDAQGWFFLGNGNCGKLYRHAAIRAVRFDAAFDIGEDLHFNFRALARTGCVVLGSRTKYHYVQTPQSLFRSPPSRERLLSCRNMLVQAREEFRGCEALCRRIDDEWYRNGLDICSKIVFFRMEQEENTCRMVRDEIRGHLKHLLASERFSRKEKMKFFLIACAWPVYCSLLLRSKRGR